MIRRCRSQPSPVRYVSNASKLRRHVRGRRTVQSTKCQRGHLEDDPFWNAKPVEADQCFAIPGALCGLQNMPKCVYGRGSAPDPARELSRMGKGYPFLYPTHSALFASRFSCGGHIWRGCCSEEVFCHPSTAPVGRTLPPNNTPPNMAAANFVLITNVSLMDAGMSN